MEICNGVLYTKTEGWTAMARIESGLVPVATEKVLFMVVSNGVMFVSWICSVSLLTNDMPEILMVSTVTLETGLPPPVRVTSEFDCDHVHEPGTTTLAFVSVWDASVAILIVRIG